MILAHFAIRLERVLQLPSPRLQAQFGEGRVLDFSEKPASRHLRIALAAQQFRFLKHVLSCRGTGNELIVGVE